MPAVSPTFGQTALDNTPIAVADQPDGFTCPDFLGQANFMFGEMVACLYALGAVTEGVGAPVAPPTQGTLPFYCDTTAMTLYVFCDGNWIEAGGGAVSSMTVEADGSITHNDGDGNLTNFLPANILTAGAAQNTVDITAPDGTVTTVRTVGANDWVAGDVQDIGTPVLINPTNNDVGCLNTGATFANEVNCTVAVAADGITHEVTVTGAGAWSYDYTVDCGGVNSTAEVSGNVDVVLPSWAVNPSIVLEPDGVTLTATPGTVNDATTVTGQWYYNDNIGGGDAIILGATGLTYMRTVDQSGGRVFYRETATGPGGGPVDQDSNIIDPLPLILNMVAETGDDFPITLVSADGTDIDVDWGDGTVSTLTSGVQFTHTYAANYAGQVRFFYTGEGNLQQINASSDFGNAQQAEGLQLEAALLPEGLENIMLGNRVTRSLGDVADLPSTLLTHTGFAFSSLTGDISTLPAGMIDMTAYFDEAISGDINNVPPALTALALFGNTTLTGVLHTVPTLNQFERLVVRGTNTVSGDIGLADFSSITSSVEFRGSTTIGGDVATTVWGGTTNFVLTGANTISGDMSDFPPTLTLLQVLGSNTLVGDVNTLSNGITRLEIGGNSALTGAVANLPTSAVEVLIGGTNTISGDIVDIPAGTERFVITGLNTITGQFHLLGSTLLEEFHVRGNNTITAPVATWVGPTTGVVEVDFQGVAAPVVRPTAEIDNILNALAAAVTAWSFPRNVVLSGPSNGAPSAASAAAITTLTGLGVTVATN